MVSDAKQTFGFPQRENSHSKWHRGTVGIQNHGSQLQNEKSLLNDVQTLRADYTD